MNDIAQDAPDYQLLFETIPGQFLVLTPRFEIVAVSNDFVAMALDSPRRSRRDDRAPSV